MSESSPRNHRPQRPEGPDASSSRHEWEQWASAPTPDTIRLRDLLITLRRRAWLVLVVTAATVTAAVYMVSREIPTYRATAVLRLADARPPLTGGLEAPMGSLGRFTDPLLSEIQLLRSRALAGAVVDSVGLRLQPEYRDFPPSLIKNVHVSRTATVDTLHLEFSKQGLGVRGATEEVHAEYGEPINVEGVQFTVTGPPKATHAIWFVLSRELAIELVLANLRVAAREQTNVVDVTYEAYRGGVAQRVVNQLAVQFQVFDARRAKEQSRLRRVFLEEQVRRTDSSIAEARLVLSTFRRREQLYSSAEELAARQRNRMMLDMRREELEADRSVYLAHLAELDGDNPEKRKQGIRALVSSPGLAANPIVSQIYGQLLLHQNALDSLTIGVFRRAETNPDVQRRNQLIVSTEVQLITMVRGHIASLDGRISALRDLRARSAAKTETLPAVEAEEMRLVHRVNTLARTGERMLEALQMASLAEAAEVGQVEIVDLAVLPYGPVGGTGTLKMGIGLILGLALGIGGAILLDHMNRSIRRHDELDAVLRLTSLATIPKLHGTQVRGLFPRVVGAKRRRNTVTESELAAEGLVVVSTQASIGGEAYRMLRTNLLFSLGDQSHNTLMVTSTAPGEGKTLTASNLSGVYARLGMRVLLVDCDLWGGRLHELFRVPRTPGLADLMKGLPIPTLDATRSTTVPGLFLLPAGTKDANPADLIRRAGMRGLLNELAEQYDLVVLDSPSVLSVADTAILAALVDGVVFVVRAGMTDREAALEALQRLATSGANVLGAVLNDPGGEAQRYGRGYERYAYPTAQHTP